MIYTLPLQDIQPTDLARAGGKGANLGALMAAGFPVPVGFCVTTLAYRLFVESNHLDNEIARLCATVRPEDPAMLETASQRIRALFEAAPVAGEITAEVAEAYKQLGRDNKPVAVRSSATAEDLPDLSFAGQQDTYLNVVGEEALLAAVRRCWGSLWTGRAIGYRMRNGIEQEKVALAVVVQVMVAAEASGVLFTANPISGKRTEAVIDATLGLGEALVSGRVEPDHYIVDPQNGKILSKRLGAKAISIRSRSEGGTQVIEETAAETQALPDPAILELARMGEQVQRRLNSPQDIEWAWANGALFLVQSRPITTLYPIPEGSSPKKLELFVSLGAVQGMLDPMTPFGQDGIQALSAGAAGVLGYPLTAQSQRIMLPAGERLFINVSGVARNRIGRKILSGALAIAEPGGKEVIGDILVDPRLAPGKRTLSPGTVMRLLRAFGPLPFIALLNVATPQPARQRTIQQAEAILENVRQQDGQAKSLAQQLELMQRLFGRLPYFMVRAMIPLFAPGLGMLNLLNAMAQEVPDGQALALEITRGMPHNVTTEMDLALWRAAHAVGRDAESARRFATQEAGSLAKDYAQNRLPKAAQEAVEEFLRRYGVRGVAELDIGRPRWGDEPTYVFQVLKSYLQITDPEAAPDRIFERRRDEAEAAIEKLARSLRERHRGPKGWIKAHQARFLAGRVRALAGLRELPKFLAVSVMAVIRGCLLRSGESLAASGLLERGQDIFFLHLNELEWLAGQQKADGLWDREVDEALTARSISAPEIEGMAIAGEPGENTAGSTGSTNASEAGAAPEHSLKQVVAGRKERYEREKRRKQVPRLLLSDGQAFYEGVQASGERREGALAGSGVSPGVVEGRVRVVFDPLQAQLQPGEILVCPGTDPAWTPLFLAAGGLVMEVGGMMTHGSVVAREYGIPAVVGVHQATTRLKSGQRVRVDGRRGEVIVLAET